MADVEFDDFRQRGNGARRVVIQAVAGVTLEPERFRLRGGDAKAASM